MKCEYCIALMDDSIYGHEATEWWCGVGEGEREFADGSIGCNRRSIDKLKRDMKHKYSLDDEWFSKGEFNEH